MNSLLLVSLTLLGATVYAQVTTPTTPTTPTTTRAVSIVPGGAGAGNAANISMSQGQNGTIKATIDPNRNNKFRGQQRPNPMRRRFQGQGSNSTSGNSSFGGQDQDDQDQDDSQSQRGNRGGKNGIPLPAGTVIPVWPGTSYLVVLPSGTVPGQKRPWIVPIASFATNGGGQGGQSQSSSQDSDDDDSQSQQRQKRQVSQQQMQQQQQQGQDQSDDDSNDQDSLDQHGGQESVKALRLPGGAIVPVKLGTTAVVVQTDGSALETDQLHGHGVPMQGVVPYEVPEQQNKASFGQEVPQPGSDSVQDGRMHQPTGINRQSQQQYRRPSRYSQQQQGQDDDQSSQQQSGQNMTMSGGRNSTNV